MVAYAVAAIVLLLCGISILLYSPWTQTLIRDGALKMLNKGEGLEFALDSFRLRFPAIINLDGLLLKQNGDTLVAARSAHVDISLLPLLRGKVSINEALLSEARYRSGAPDSAMYMTIAADSIALAPASVTLSDMDINLEEGAIRGGRLALYLYPDTAEPKPPSAPDRKSVV